MPKGSTLILDENPEDWNLDLPAVFQDFRMDIFDAMQTAKIHLGRYRKVVVVFPEKTNHPTEILLGIGKYCDETKLEMRIIGSTNNILPEKETVFITLSDMDLADVIRSVRATPLQIGKDVGVLSFNEAILNELLSITVVTTDFAAMGLTAAA